MAKKELSMFETRIDIDVSTRQEIITTLNAQLADTFDMFSLMKQAHWNVKGPQFIALHKLFDEIAAGLLGHVDIIAERITALGGVALGTVRMAAERSRLDPYPLDGVDSLETVKGVSVRMAHLAATTRDAAERAEALNDMGTNDLLLEASSDVDKWLWFLEAHLQA